MPKLMSPSLITALGLCLDMWGTLGGISFRHDPALGIIAYWERRKMGALTPAQERHRVRFQRGYEQWNTLSAEEKDDWRHAADRFSTRMVGSHLFLRVWWYQDQHFLAQADLHLNLQLNLPGP